MSNASENTALLSIHNLSVSYAQKPVLWDINLELPQGKVIGIIGPNGAGKSTLLKSMMGLISIDSGSIAIFGKPLQESRKRVSYVPQRTSVDWDFPASVFDVVLMGRYRILACLSGLGRLIRILPCML